MDAAFYYGIIVGMASIVVGGILGFVCYHFAQGASPKLVKVFNQGGESSGEGGMSYEDDDGGDGDDKDNEKVETPPAEHSVGVPFRPNPPDNIK